MTGPTRLAPWASPLAGLLTLVYLTIREWRQRENKTETESEGESQTDGDSSIAQLVFLLDPVVSTALSILFITASLHCLLVFTPFTFLVVPVWLLAVFVILATGPGDARRGVRGQTGASR